jgi:hypothetical protein
MPRLRDFFDVNIVVYLMCMFLIFGLLLWALHGVSLASIRQEATQPLTKGDLWFALFVLWTAIRK